MGKQQNTDRIETAHIKVGRKNKTRENGRKEEREGEYEVHMQRRKRKEEKEKNTSGEKGKARKTAENTEIDKHFKKQKNCGQKHNK